MFIFGLLIAVTLAISWAFAPKKAYAQSNHHPSNHPALGFNQLDHPRPPDIVSWPPAHYAEIINENDPVAQHAPSVSYTQRE
jgi:hypothetical protein